MDYVASGEAPACLNWRTRVSEFEAIRPYQDHEVPQVVARVMKSPALVAAATELLLPGWLAGNPFGRWLATWLLRYRARNLVSIRDVQALISKYLELLVERSITALSVSGLSGLDPNRTYLFVSNHRDIVLDSGLLNYILHREGHDTCRMAVGDNLLGNSLVGDLMRLNKSFVVERSVNGKRAQYRTLARTSAYIRQSLAAGVSVWIAQRPGRAKDGFDRTDTAVLKMLLLAYRGEEQALSKLLKTPIVPVAVSYEVDPCGPLKAKELCAVATHGQYQKSPQEDIHSMVKGVTEYKGRVHLTFGRPISSAEDAGSLAAEIDQAIVGGLRIFPTHRYARAVKEHVQGELDGTDDAVTALQRQLDACELEERPYLLDQYANIWRNRDELGIE